MRKVHLSSTLAELKEAVARAMSTQPRVVLLVDGIATEIGAFANMLAVAKQVSDLYAQGTGASPGPQTKFRIVILVGNRSDFTAEVGK